MRRRSKVLRNRGRFARLTYPPTARQFGAAGSTCDAAPFSYWSWRSQPTRTSTISEMRLAAFSAANRNGSDFGNLKQQAGRIVAVRPRPGAWPSRMKRCKLPEKA